MIVEDVELLTAKEYSNLKSISQEVLNGIADHMQYDLEQGNTVPVVDLRDKILGKILSTKVVDDTLLATLDIEINSWPPLDFYPTIEYFSLRITRITVASKPCKPVLQVGNYDGIQFTPETLQEIVDKTNNLIDAGLDIPIQDEWGNTVGVVDSVEYHNQQILVNLNAKEVSENE